MQRTCYNCDTDLTLQETVNGQNWLDWTSNYPDGEFEGWVHCEGSENIFIQESDTELLQWLEKLPYAKSMSYVHGTIVCAACVKSKFEVETGIQMKYEEECGCESIKY